MQSSHPVFTDLSSHCNWGSSSTTACQPSTACNLVTSVLPAAHLQLRATFKHWTLNISVTTSPLLWQRQSASGSRPAEIVPQEPYWKHTFLQKSHRLVQDHPNSYPSPSQLASFPPDNMLIVCIMLPYKIHTLATQIPNNKNHNSFQVSHPWNTPAPGHTRSSCYLHSPPITVTGKTVLTQGILLTLSYCQLTDNWWQIWVFRKKEKQPTFTEAPFVFPSQYQLQSEAFPPHLSISTALVFPAPYTQSLPSPSARQHRRRGSVRNGFSATPCFLLIFFHCWLLLNCYFAPAGVPALEWRTYRLRSLWLSLCPSTGLPWAAVSSGLGHPQAAVPSGVRILALTWLICSPQSTQECSCSSVQPPEGAVPLGV